MNIIQLIPLIVFIAVAFFEVLTKRKLAQGQISDEPLNSTEKILTWLFCFLNPVLAGAILYYGWKKVLPVKAKQANNISLWAFLLAIILFGVLLFTGVIDTQGL